jgi:hypothetical protein
MWGSVARCLPWGLRNESPPRPATWLFFSSVTPSRPAGCLYRSHGPRACRGPMPSAPIQNRARRPSCPSTRSHPWSCRPSTREMQPKKGAQGAAKARYAGDGQTRTDRPEVIQEDQGRVPHDSVLVDAKVGQLRPGLLLLRPGGSSLDLCHIDPIPRQDAPFPRDRINEAIAMGSLPWSHCHKPLSPTSLALSKADPRSIPRPHRIQVPSNWKSPPQNRDDSHRFIKLSAINACSGSPQGAGTRRKTQTHRLREPQTKRKCNRWMRS